MFNLLPTGGVLRFLLVLLPLTFASAIVATFLPLALTSAETWLAPVALLIQAGLTAITRWASGRAADRYGSRHLLPLGVLCGAFGVGCLIAAPGIAPVLIGAALFGVGLGTIQNLTMLNIMNMVPAQSYGAASAWWNLVYDTSLGLGSLLFGVAVGLIGYPVAFGATAAVVMSALIPILATRAPTFVRKVS